MDASRLMKSHALLRPRFVKHFKQIRGYQQTFNKVPFFGIRAFSSNFYNFQKQMHGRTALAPGVAGLRGTIAYPGIFTLNSRSKGEEASAR